MRNPERRDGDDARPDRTDDSTPQAGSDGGPADGGTAGVPRRTDRRRSPGGRTAHRHRRHPKPTGPTDFTADSGVGSEPSDGGLGPPDDPVDFDDPVNFDDPVTFDGSADFDDDLLFDPLLSDEPIDLAAVRADDALIDALGGGDLAAADDLVDPDDPLIAMLAAWAASARPDAERRRERGRAGPVDQAAPARRSCGRRRGPSARPLAPKPRVPDRPAGGPTAVGAGRRHRRRNGCRRHRSHDTSAFPPPSICPPHERQPAARLRRRRTRGPAPTPATRLAGTPLPGRRGRRACGRLVVSCRGSCGRPAVPARSCAGVRGRRGRPCRRATRCAGPRSPSSSRRSGISGAAASGGTAMPGDPAWAISGCSSPSGRDRSRRRRSCPRAWNGPSWHSGGAAATLAAQELAAVSAALPIVREEEGHTQLVDQQRMLAGRRGADPAAGRPEPHHHDDPDPARRSRHLGPRAGPPAAGPGRQPSRRHAAGRHRARRPGSGRRHRRRHDDRRRRERDHRAGATGTDDRHDAARGPRAPTTGTETGTETTGTETTDTDARAPTTGTAPAPRRRHRRPAPHDRHRDHWHRNAPAPRRPARRTDRHRNRHRHRDDEAPDHRHGSDRDRHRPTGTDAPARTPRRRPVDTGAPAATPTGRAPLPATWPTSPAPRDRARRRSAPRPCAPTTSRRGPRCRTGRDRDRRGARRPRRRRAGGTRVVAEGSAPAVPADDAARTHGDAVARSTAAPSSRRAWCPSRSRSRSTRGDRRGRPAGSDDDTATEEHSHRRQRHRRTTIRGDDSRRGRRPRARPRVRRRPRTTTEAVRGVPLGPR